MDGGWWYDTQERRIRLEGGRTHTLPGAVHAERNHQADPAWSICAAA